MARRRRPRGRHREAARDDDDLPGRGARPHGRSQPVAVVPVAGRAVAVPLVEAARRSPDGLLPARLRRGQVGDDPGALQLADAGLRPADLHEHHLSVAAGPARPARRARGRQPGRVVPHDVHRPRRLGRPPGRAALRRRRLRVLRLGQRPARRISRRQPNPCRVRHHDAPDAGFQPPGRRGLSLQRRRLPRGPGHVAHVGDLPRRLPLEPRRRPRAGLRGADPARPHLSRRHAARDRHADGRRRRGHAHRRPARTRRTGGPHRGQGDGSRNDGDGDTTRRQSGEMDGGDARPLHAAPHAA